MSVVHYNSGVFYAWIDGVLQTIPIGGEASSVESAKFPFFPESEDREFESPPIFKSSPSIINEVTFTTTGNIDDLDFGNSPLIRMNNASDATIRGLKAGYPGQIVTIISIGAGHVFLAYQNTNSSANNRLINFAISGNTPLATGKGTATYQYDGTTLRWRLVVHTQGATITRAFSSSNYTALTGGNTWTVEAADIVSEKYILNGKLLTLIFDYHNTTLAGVVEGNLVVAIPGGFTNATGDQWAVGVAENVGGVGGGGMLRIRAVSGSGNLYLSPTGDTWKVQTNSIAAYGSISIEVM